MVNIIIAMVNIIIIITMVNIIIIIMAKNIVIRNKEMINLYYLD
jgi:hypothetical protein